MLVWPAVFAALVVVAVAIVLLAVWIFRAERRARRHLYRSLGLNEETVDLLMARNRDVLSELALVRLEPLAAQAQLELRAPSRRALNPKIRLVHPVDEQPRDDGPERRINDPGDRRF